MINSNNINKVLDYLNYEIDLHKKGFKYIAGVDEVGRGPLAGPLVAAAVILDLDKILKVYNDLLTYNDVINPKNDFYTKIKDSKKVNPIKRPEISRYIIKEAISYSIIPISNKVIDERGISFALQTAFFNSIVQLEQKPDYVLTDAFEIKRLTIEHQTNIIRGDSKSISIAAASIIAKVYRDRLMDKLHTKYPVYGFNKHKGYGTEYHINALKRHGPCNIHRFSFEPIKSMVNFDNPELN